MNPNAPKLRYGIIAKPDGSKIEVPLPRFHAGRESLQTSMGTFQRARGNVYRSTVDHNVTMTIK